MLKPTRVSFECLRDKRANLCFASLVIPDVSGIDTRRVRYVPSHDKILIVLGWVRREFRRESEVSTVGSSDILRLTDLEGSLSWSYRTCSVFILDGWPEANG